MASEWRELPISEAAEVVGGGTPSTREEANFNGDIPWITPRDLSGYPFRYISHGERDISTQGLQNSSARLLPKGCILLTTRAPVGYVAIACASVTTNQGFRSLVPRDGFLSEFIYYLLKSKTEYLKNHASGTTFGELSGTTLKSLRFLFPPLPEQRAVAHILGTMDDKIELNRRMNQTLEAMAQALFKSWFVDFEPFRDQGMQDSTLGPIPRAWHIATVGEVAAKDKHSIVDGPFGTQMKVKEYVEAGVPVIEMEFLEDVPFYREFNSFITEGKYETVKRSTVREGDIVISKTGTLGLLGIMTDYWKKAILVSRLAKITPDTGKVNRYYLFQVLKQLRNEDYWNRISSGSTMPLINLGHIKSTPILLPPLDVQNKYGQIVSKFYNFILKNLRQNQTIAIIRDSLLPKLLSGQIRVKDAEKLLREAV